MRGNGSRTATSAEPITSGGGEVDLLGAFERDGGGSIPIATILGDTYRVPLSFPGFRSSLVRALICRQLSVDGGMSAFLKGQSYVGVFRRLRPEWYFRDGALGRLRVRGKGLRPS
jgi:hypothetical protein